jgi:hypothetical protein
MTNRWAAAFAVGCGLLAAGSVSAATKIVTTLSGDMESGTFGSAVESGEDTVISGHPETWNYTIVENLGGTIYTYHYTNTSGNSAPSQVPPTPCIIAGCTGPTPNGDAEFSKPFASHQPIPFGDGLAITQFRDGVFDYSGFGTLTEVITSTAPEPAVWALLLVGFGGVGAAMRTRRKIVSVA